MSESCMKNWKSQTHAAVTLLPTLLLIFVLALLAMPAAQAAVAYNFECTESGAAYNNLKATPSARNPLYTKLAGSPFGFDVYALKSDGTQETSYTGPVKIELVDGNMACGSATLYQTVSASQVLTSGKFAVPVSVTVNNAYKNVSCRVTDLNTPALQYCSSDKFSIRPASFAATVTKADNSALSSIIKAGLDDIKATVSVATAGYAGSAGFYPSLSVDHNNVTVNGRGTLTKADAGNTPLVDPASPSEVSFAVTSAVPGSGNFRYHDAGTLTLAIRDKTYTSIDPASSNPAISDCIFGSASNTPDSGGKYGCDIGLDKPIARFVPDHFTVTGSLTPACGAGFTGFTYMDEPRLGINLTVSAKSKSEITAAQYANPCPPPGPCKLTLTALNNTTQIDITRLQPLASFPSALSFGSGATSSYQSSSWLNGVYTVSGSTFNYARYKVPPATPTTPTTPDGAYDNFKLKAALTDPDGVAITTGSDTTNETKVRYGRLALSNAYGSELLGLPMPMKLQYFKSGSGWLGHTDDSCTQITLPADIAINYAALGSKNTLAANSVKAYLKNLTGVEISSGTVRDSRLSLASPGSAAVGPGMGYVNVYVELASMPWLNFNWQGKSSPTAPELNPYARATFGVHKKTNSFIYQREAY